MALDIRPNCEFCDKDLPPESTEARICSYECTFCVGCVREQTPQCVPQLRRGLRCKTYSTRDRVALRPFCSRSVRPPSRRVHLSYTLDQPTTGRLPLRQGEARPRAPRSEMIESRPERAPRRPEPRRPHPLRRRSAQAFSNRPATAGGRARMTGRAPTCAVVAARRYSDCTTVRGPPRPPLPTATRRGRRRTPTPLGLKMAVPLA